MATASLAPSASSVGPSKAKKPKQRRRKQSGGKPAKRSGGRASGLWASIKKFTSSGKVGQASKAAMVSGEILGPMALASLAEGYRETQGKSLNIGTEKFSVDARVVLGVGALSAALWKGSTNPHFLAVGTGILASYLHGKAYEGGSKLAQKWGGAATAAATVPSAQPSVSSGIVVGKLFGKRDLDVRIEKLKDKYEKAMGAGHTKRAARLFGRLQKLRALKRFQGGGGAKSGSGIRSEIRQQVAYDD